VRTATGLFDSQEVTVSTFDRQRSDREHRAALATAWVVPEPSRCVQCGVCTFNCPVGIDVRRHVWRGEPVKDSYCLTCGECVKRCPRGLLRFEEATSTELTRSRSVGL
jgi:ferredoxin